MAAASYDSTTLGWQSRQTLQRFQEWLEYQFSGVDMPSPDLPEWTWPQQWARVVFWLMVVGLAAYLGWILYRLGQRYWQQRARWLANRSPVQVVPEAELRPVPEWWREANALALAGRYREACRSLYLGALQKLHDRQQILHQLSRTDQEYLTALAQQPRPRPYELLIRTHERMEFGDGIASQETYQRCRQAFQELEQP